MAVGIVCEFSPCHNGHKYLIEQAKQISASRVVCAISGFFVQRGEAAFCPAKTRAEWAVSAGADLVLENPFPFSCATAEHFAKGAVSVLCGSGLCDMLAFGAEDGTENEFFELAEILADKNTAKQIASVVKDNKNMSFAQARVAYIHEKYGNISRLLCSPNSLLGVEYAKSALMTGRNIKLIVIPRIGASHDGTPVNNISSASYLRENADKIDIYHFCPDYVAEYFKQNSPFAINEKAYYTALSAAILTRPTEEIALTAELPHGYASRIIDACKKHSAFVGFFEEIKSKHLTNAHLRRMLIYLLTGVDADMLKSAPSSSRLLAFSDVGTKLLRQRKKDCEHFTVLSKLSDMKKLEGKELLREQKALYAEKIFTRMA